MLRKALTAALVSMLPWRAANKRSEAFLWSCYVVSGYCYYSTFFTPPIDAVWLIAPWATFAAVNIVISWVRFERSSRALRKSVREVHLLTIYRATGNTDVLPGYLQEEQAMARAQAKLNGEIDY
jgi:hypothetical protein